MDNSGQTRAKRPTKTETRRDDIFSITTVFLALSLFVRRVGATQRFSGFSYSDKAIEHCGWGLRSSLVLAAEIIFLLSFLLFFSAMISNRVSKATATLVFLSFLYLSLSSATFSRALTYINERFQSKFKKEKVITKSRQFASLKSD